MAFNFGAIVRIGEPINPDLYPVLTGDGEDFQRTGGECDIQTFAATGLEIRRADGHSSKTLFDVKDSRCQWTLTDRRLVMSCSKYDTGKKWVGFGWAWVAAILISKTTAAVRRRGKRLIGQLDLRCIESIKYQERHGRLRPAVIVIGYRDGTDDAPAVRVNLTVYLDKDTKVRPLAQTIIDTAVNAHLAETDRLSNEERARLQEGLQLNESKATDKELVHRSIPGARPVIAQAGA